MVLHYGDLADSTCLVKIISEVKPDEVYNLGAMSHVKVSFDMAEYTGNVDGTPGSGRNDERGRRWRRQGFAAVVHLTLFAGSKRAAPRLHLRFIPRLCPFAGLGTLRLLDALRTAGLGDTVRFYQASTR